MVSNFDDMKTSANYGRWLAGSDGMNSGKSTSSIQAVAGGANGSTGALQITGELVAGAQFLWGGALFAPGGSPSQSVNLSGKKTVTFWAKGDGKTYTIAALRSRISLSAPIRIWAINLTDDNNWLGQNRGRA